MNETAQIQTIIVTGFSGAGMSSALKHMEDMGYEVFDNFPLPLVDALLAESSADGKSVVIGIDTRSRGFTPEVLLNTVKKAQAALVFVTAEETALLKRFAETRRRHPLSADRPASAGIKKEQELLHNLKSKADIVIDTSMLSVHDLRRVLEGHFKKDAQAGLTVTLMSFGFKHGLPREADIVMDLRFLKNPHWVPELKPLTGKDKAVGEYVAGDEAFEDFVTHFKSMMKPLLPRYAQEGKSYLTIALGCTGGRHRSVYTAETLAKFIKDEDFQVNLFHRDIDRASR